MKRQNIINALPPKFLQKRFPLLFNGAFAGMRGWGSWGGGSQPPVYCGCPTPRLTRYTRTAAEDT